jgi:hypothetical protein
MAVEAGRGIGRGEEWWCGLDATEWSA